MTRPKQKKKKIRHVHKRKSKNSKEQTEQYSKTRRLVCNKCGARNWPKQHECPAKGKKCIKCGKLGHYAKCCRSARKINHTADEEVYSAEEDQIDYIQFNKRYTEWKQKARTDHQSWPKHYWLTADQ